MMSVDVSGAASFEASAPHALFEFRSGNGLTFVSPYAAAADGKRFLINTIVDESDGAPLTLVINWQELLRRYVRTSSINLVSERVDFSANASVTTVGMARSCRATRWTACGRPPAFRLARGFSTSGQEPGGWPFRSRVADATSWRLSRLQACWRNCGQRLANTRCCLWPPKRRSFHFWPGASMRW